VKNVKTYGQFFEPLYLLMAILNTGADIYAGDKHLCQLDTLAPDDEPESTSSIDENIVGLDHNSLVVWEFSNDSDGDKDAVEEW